MFLFGCGANLFEFGKGKYKDGGLIKAHLRDGSEGASVMVQTFAGWLLGGKKKLLMSG
jgi:hypothetical protein